MNDCTPIRTEGSQRVEIFLIQNLRQHQPIAIRHRHRRLDRGRLFFEDGQLEAHKDVSAEGTKPWLILSGKGGLGLPWDEWLEHFGNEWIDWKRKTEKGWEDIDAK